MTLTGGVAKAKRGATRGGFGFRLPGVLIPLGLLLIALAINAALQDTLFTQRALAGNLRVFAPLALLAAGQTLVILGGGVDLSVGAQVTLVNAVLAVLVTRESTPYEIVLGVLAALGVGAAAGLLNGLGVALLRLQPIVTTYATSFVFTGLALWVLPRPGGAFPRDLTGLYRSAPLGLPFAGWVLLGLVGVWWLLRATRWGQALFAVGGDAQAAYTSGIDVAGVRLSTYVLAGLMSGLAGFALTMNTGTGSPRIGDAMTLDSIVAVVLGGTRLSGGQGGVVGSVIGVVLLGTIRNVISFANVPTWNQTLVDALIILSTLAGPALVRLVVRWLRGMGRRRPKPLPIGEAA